MILRGSISKNFGRASPVHLPGLRASTIFAQALLPTLLASSSPATWKFVPSRWPSLDLSRLYHGTPRRSPAAVCRDGSRGFFVFISKYHTHDLVAWG